MKCGILEKVGHPCDAALDPAWSGGVKARSLAASRLATSAETDLTCSLAWLSE